MNRNDLTRTAHAKARQQQRAINDLAIRLIQEFGTYAYQQGGCEIAYVEKSMLKDLRSAVEKLASVKIVVNQDNRIITAMHANKKIRTTKLVA